jgi:phosphatidylinositol alpha 1,6-mannosyltransferase
MQIDDLRIAMTSGNYNYTRDGANKALNRLVGWLLSEGAAVRVYSPVVEKPAFAAVGDLVGTPSLPVPLRPDYRIPMGLGRVRADVDAFRPNVVHVSAPEFLGHSAVSYAEARALPVLGSVHTRFDTYFRYYRLGFIEPTLTALLRRFYRRCDALVCPSESMAAVLREQGMNDDISIWSRGVEHELFNPARRSLDWRRSLGIGDDEVVIGFFSRLVLEKGVDVVGEVLRELKRRHVPHRVLIVGEGPARDAFVEAVPDAILTGHLEGEALARAVASFDVLLFPSITETFGNVTLEAMASGVAVVGANATGTSSLVEDGVTGRLIAPRDIGGYADALAHYIAHPDARRAAGAAGLAASRAYSWDSINRAVADAYLRIIARRAHAPKSA